jgi:hypothetical protein
MPGSPSPDDAVIDGYERHVSSRNVAVVATPLGRAERLPDICPGRSCVSSIEMDVLR